LLFSTHAQAVGLGNISISSFLGQPLQARIALVAGPDQFDIDQLNAGQLNNRQASDIGIELAGYYQDFQPRLVARDGQVFIELRSQVPINEPYLNILIKLSWYGGKVFREYTLLLDPQRINVDDTATAQVPSSERSSQKTASSARRSTAAAVASNATSSAAGAMNGSTFEVGDTHYRVQSGDSLSRIAARLVLARDTRRSTMMQWLLAQNPSAFISADINRLKAGALLVLPQGPGLTSQAAVDTIAAPNSEAVAIVQPPEATQTPAQQAPEPQDASSQSEQLTIVTNPTGLANAGSASEYEQVALLQAQLANTNEMVERLRRDNLAMRNRLAAIEESKYVASLERLVQLKEEEIGALQQRMDEPLAAPSAAGVTLATEAAPMPQPQTVQNPETAQRYGLYLLLVLAIAGALFFFYRRRITEQSQASLASVDPDEALRRELDEIIASRTGAIATAKKRGAKEIVDLGPIGPQNRPVASTKSRVDKVLMQSIQEETITYRPPELDPLEQGEHNQLDERVTLAIKMAGRQDFDGAIALLKTERAEQQRFGGSVAADERLDVAMEYVLKLQRSDIS